jgi:hypothetical protein
MSVKVNMMVSYFIQVKVVIMSLQDKDGHFFSTGNIYNDLMKLQQGLIDNNSFEERKFMSYFM